MKMAFQVIGFLVIVALLISVPLLGDRFSGWAGWVMGILVGLVWLEIVHWIYKHADKKKEE